MPNVNDSSFPCKIGDLISTTLLSIPVLGPIINFYPILNIATVPVIIITWRNNIYFTIYN